MLPRSASGKGITIAATALLALVSAAAAVERLPVDVELVLAVDVSSSMMEDELALQRQGYASAFRQPDVVKAIEIGRYGRIAVTYFEWGGQDSRATVVPWTLVASAGDAAAVAGRLEAGRLGNFYRTSIAAAIRHAIAAFAESGYRGTRRVLDVSGDGPNNEGGDVADARDAALAAGIVINGLPVVIEGRAFGEDTVEYLDDYYRDCVVGGPNSFVMPVRGWDQFADAVRRKLLVELAGDRPPVLHASGETRDATARIDCRIGEKSWSEMEKKR